MVSVVTRLALSARAAALARVLATTHARDICKNLLVIDILPGSFWEPFVGGPRSRALNCTGPPMLGPIAGSVKAIAAIG
jgi:hypothetical protein